MTVNIHLLTMMESVMEWEGEWKVTREKLRVMRERIPSQAFIRIWFVDLFQTRTSWWCVGWFVLRGALLGWYHRPLEVPNSPPALGKPKYFQRSPWEAEWSLVGNHCSPKCSLACLENTTRGEQRVAVDLRGQWKNNLLDECNAPLLYVHL